ncbi:hypothetical protein O181_008178 [Austropuccinia psidii MF-1]|uniref:CTLH domain-containing protein n=1 Tax=Austropuccinia psidii MF-1 TaxID=1389203 RepID=A0A9Q3BNW6_9BASI|nr:hypothetical protein [Austropuccinia psidii MF-1]
MSSRIKHDDVLLLEQPFLKVPTDSLRASFKSTQKVIERDFEKFHTTVTQVVQKTTSFASNSNHSSLDSSNQHDETVKAIDGLLTKARSLKRKVDETFNNPQTGTISTLGRIKARLDHLQDLYNSEYATDPSYEKFSRIRLDRHLVDYLLRSGYTKSAQSLSQFANIEALVDEPLFTELNRIEKALAEHSCSEALAWCKENSGALKKMQSTLEFELRYQEFIELVKAKKFHEAISYSQKQLVPWQSTHLAEISQVMTLLAFDQRTSCPPYARLYDDNRWADLLANFRSTLFALHAIPEQPFLYLSLSVGLASLKLPACYNKPTPTTTEDVEMLPSSVQSRLSNLYPHALPSNSSHGHHHSPPSNYDPNLVKTSEDDVLSQRNPDCPICDSAGLGELAKECPWSHHVNSIIVCGLTGKVVNDGDGLAVLPNGRVYSRDGLEKMAYKDEGRVKCPRTGQIYGMDEIRRVFIS